MKTILDLEDVHADPDNVRVHTERGEAALENSVEKFGAARSIVLDRNNRVVAGNGTLAAARAAGIDKVQVVETDGRTLIAVKRSDWSEAEASEYGVADNRSAEFSEWDYEGLSKMFSQEDFDHEAAGFSQAEVDSIMANATWIGEAEDVVAQGRTSAKELNPVRMQITLLDADLAPDVREAVEAALEKWEEHVVLEDL